MNEREIFVHMHRGGSFVLAGRLLVAEDGPHCACAFQYAPDYARRADAVAVDPVLLPLDAAPGHVFEGETGALFGGIRDALPDDWGRHVLDSAAQAHGVRLGEVDYALYAGPDRVGALGFCDTRAGAPFSQQALWARGAHGLNLSLEDLLRVADAVDSAQSLPAALKRFLVRGSSLGGAQPKAAVEYEGALWIAKFGKAREALPTCRIEHATLHLAQKCGIRVPETRRITVFDSRDILLVRRFDREGLQRIPFISAMTLTNTPLQKQYDASYADIAFSMRSYCSTEYMKSDVEELFARMLFNIFCNNYDDHLRNHGFIYTGVGERDWRLSPAYDIVPQLPMDTAPAVLHLGVGPQGRLATVDNALEGCAAFGLSREAATQIAERLAGIIAHNWESAMLDAGVPQRHLPALQQCFVGRGL